MSDDPQIEGQAIHEMIAEIVSRVAQQFADRLEQACEAGLQTGTSGVRVAGQGYDASVAVDSAVPYGQIYYFPDMEAYEFWRMTKGVES